MGQEMVIWVGSLPPDQGQGFSLYVKNK